VSDCALTTESNNKPGRYAQEFARILCTGLGVKSGVDKSLKLDEKHVKVHVVAGSMKFGSWSYNSAFNVENARQALALSHTQAFSSSLQTHILFIYAL
jgi:hypothetical protein